MNQVSVVLIAKNEAHIITDTIRSVQALTDDIIVVDSGSTDGTQQAATALGAKVIDTAWLGYGPTKNKGITAAKYDWILSIDADEMPDAKLVENVRQINSDEKSTVYNIAFKTFFGQRLIRFGEWGRDSHIRLFNRTKVSWNDAAVHEQLVLPPGTAIKQLNGHILHYTMKDLAEYAQKMTSYALLNAERYHRQGKRAGWFKRRLSPRFSFFQNYILKLGFLDGRAGYLIARMSVYYTFLKYERLYELNEAGNP